MLHYLSLNTRVLCFALISSAQENCTCNNLTAHGTSTQKWMQDKNANLLMMSRAHFNNMAEILTGSFEVDIAEDPCFKNTGYNMKNETTYDLKIYGFKAVADYECTYGGAPGSNGCHPRSGSTNAEWAKKLPPGKPITIYSDDESYAIQVRCPVNHERFWFVKSIREALCIEEQMVILSILKAHNLNIDNAVTFSNEKCDKITKSIKSPEEAWIYTNLTAHGVPTYNWMQGKDINVFMMSRANYVVVANVLTGTSKISIAEDPCLKLANWKNGTNYGFTYHGFKSIADYQCAFGSASDVKGCEPTRKSTNLEWAKKMPIGKNPVTLWNKNCEKIIIS